MRNGYDGQYRIIIIIIIVIIIIIIINVKPLV